MCSKSVDLCITVRSVYKKWGAKSSVHCGTHDKNVDLSFIISFSVLLTFITFFFNFRIHLFHTSRR